MKESPLLLIHGKKESVTHHPQPAEGYLVLKGLKGKVVLCNRPETNGILDRAGESELLCLTGGAKPQGAALSNGFFGTCIYFEKYYP